MNSSFTDCVLFSNSVQYLCYNCLKKLFEFMSKNTDGTLIINDENIANSYGFKIPTKGIGLKRFKKNPVMLKDHRNSLDNVLGSFTDLKVEKGLLTGKPLFVSDDEDVSKIQNKFDQGFIRACSMGIIFHRDDLKLIADQLFLNKCELMEVSLVAVPSNANAVRLYAAETFKEGEVNTPLTEEEIRNLCLSLQPVTDPVVIKSQKLENKNMSKVKLSASSVKALGLAAGTTEIDAAEIDAKILVLSSKLDAANASLKTANEKVTAFELAAETATLSSVTTQVETAITEGRITADKKEDFINLGVSNPELLKNTLAGIPAKKNFSAAVSGTESKSEVKTKEDFMALSQEEKLAFKSSNPNEYRNLFTKNK